MGPGLLVLLGVVTGDGEAEAEKLARKTAALRIFDDAKGAMNLSVEDVKGEVLVVSQFTLAADTRKGRRPSFIRAARPEEANALYGRYVEALRARGLKTETGRFQTVMAVHLVNDGPVTILLEA
ncbi:MAG: D-aminoacyl-tRNA deacylase [Planctomycetota bacterium]